MPRFPNVSHVTNWKDPETDEVYFFNGKSWFHNGRSVEPLEYTVNGEIYYSRKCSCGVIHMRDGGKHSSWCAVKDAQ